MPRVFLHTTIALGDVVTIAGDEGHHYSRVLRAQSSEPIAVVGDGVPYLGTVLTADSRTGELTVKIESRMEPHEPSIRVSVVQGLAKGDKIEEIIEKCTESGAYRFVIFPSLRSVVRLDDTKLENRLVRWRKVAREAAAQSQRDIVPEVTYTADKESLLRDLSESARSAVLFLDESENTLGIRQALEAIKNDGLVRSIALVIGPEGGFADEERDWFRTKIGALPITLGPRILRTENAGLMALSATLYEYGDMGG